MKKKREIQVGFGNRFKKVQAALLLMQTVTMETECEIMELTAKPYMYCETVGFRISNGTGRVVNLAVSNTNYEEPYIWYGKLADFDHESGNVYKNGDAKFSQGDTMLDTVEEALEWLVNGKAPV